MLLSCKLSFPGTGSPSRAALLQDTLWCRMVQLVSPDTDD